jgi:hypothetical protein
VVHQSYERAIAFVRQSEHEPFSRLSQFSSYSKPILSRSCHASTPGFSLFDHCGCVVRVLLVQSDDPNNHTPLKAHNFTSPTTRKPQQATAFLTMCKVAVRNTKAMCKVAFGNTKVVTIEPVKSKDQWFTAAELQIIRQEGVWEAKSFGVARGLELLENEETPESFSSDRSCSVYRKNHVKSILTLQEEHQEQGIVDMKGLQSLSQALSKDSAKRAQQRAVEDSIEAFDIHVESEIFLAYSKATSAKEYAQKTRRPISLASRGRCKTF